MQLNTQLKSTVTQLPLETGPDKNVNVLIASRDTKSLDELYNLLSNAPGYRVTTNLILNGNSNPLLGINTKPDIIIFKVSDQWRRELEELPTYLNGLDLEKIIVSDSEEHDCMRMAIQAGARDFISPPLSSNSLIDSIRRLRAEMGSIKRKGQLVSVINAKGGGGASFIASNLAHVMAVVSKLNVVLLDLDLQFGHLCHYLNMEPQRGLMEAIQHIEDLDEVALHAYLLKHNSGLKIMETNPQGVALPEDIPDQKLSILLDLLLLCHDELIVDLPRQIDLITSTVLERSNKVLVVLQQDISALRDATRLLSIFRKDLGLDDSHIEVVINRYDKRSNISREDIQKALKVIEPHTIPNDFSNAHDCIDTGVPLYEYNRRAPSTRAIMTLESALAGKSAQGGNSFVNLVTSYFKRV